MDWQSKSNHNRTTFRKISTAANIDFVGKTWIPKGDLFINSEHPNPKSIFDFNHLTLKVLQNWTKGSQIHDEVTTISRIWLKKFCESQPKCTKLMLNSNNIFFNLRRWFNFPVKFSFPFWSSTFSRLHKQHNPGKNHWVYLRISKLVFRIQSTVKLGCNELYGTMQICSL